MLGVEHVEGVRPQLPGGRVGEGGLCRVQGAGAQLLRPAGAVGAAYREALSAVEVPEARGVGAVHQLALLGPAGLGDRVPVAAVHHRLLAQCPVRAEVPHVQAGVVPRHPRVVPGDPGQVLAVGGQRRGDHEVRARHQCAHAGVIAGGRAVQRNGDQGVHGLAAASVVLADRVDQAPARVDLQVAVSHVPVDRERDQAPHAVRHVVPVEAPVPGVRDHDDPAVDGVGPPSVLVHPGAHIDQLVGGCQRKHLTDLSVTVAAEQYVAARL